MELKEIAKIIANKAGMPYVWEDVLNRLEEGKALPFKLKQSCSDDKCDCGSGGKAFGFDYCQEGCDES